MAERTLWLTASRRLARLRREEEGRRMRSAGRRAWDEPAIQPLDEWILAATEEDSHTPLLLSPVAARALWLRVVGASGDADPGPLATLAAEAWRLLHLYGIGLEELEREGGEDVQRFLTLAHAYRTRLADLGAEDHARRLAAAAERLRTYGPRDAPRVVVRVGFLRPPPVVEEVFSSLAARGIALRDESLPSPVVPRLYEAADPEDEWRAAARWLRSRLEERPEGLFALVVPELDGVRRPLERILEEGLEPDGLFAPARRRRVLNMAGGTPLAEEPAVAAAVRLVRLALAGLEPPEWSALLTSPYWGGGLGASRWRDELALRRLVPVRSYDVRSLPRVGLDPEGDLLHRLERAHEIVPRDPPRSLASWIETIRRWLGFWGWPGPGADSNAHQARRAHTEVLDGLHAASVVHEGTVRAEDFLFLYEDALAERLFQPEVRGARVLILEPRDVAGLRLDGLWVAGLHAGAWPPPAGVTPFLPAALARRRGLPRCDVPSALAEARLLDAAWRRVAPEIVYSRARHDGDLGLRPSPLLVGLEAAREPPQGDDRGWRGRIFARRAEFPRACVPASEPAPFVGTFLKGGARILAEQALCPFRGFAARIEAEPLPPFASPLDPRVHGSLLHEALERLAVAAGGWGPETAVRLERMLPGIVAETLAARADDPAFSPGLVAVEAVRLERLLRAWLGFEKAVGGARRWEAEVETGYVGGGVEVRLRIDRVDRGADGRGVVLDYKTTRGSDTRRYDPTDENPQLWLYALAEPDIAAVGYLVFHGEGPEVQASALGAADTLWATVPGYESTSDWSGLLTAWRSSLERLFEDIRTGHAVLAPRRGDETCRRCPYPLFCRRDSLLAAAESDPAGDA
jgi:probable DNA repair protein